jgi:hypothetical protein
VTENEQRLLLEAWSVFDSWMQDDPTCKASPTAEARVKAFCQVYGQFLLPDYQRIRKELEREARRS